VDYGPRVDDRRQGLSSSASRPTHNGRDDHDDTPPSRHLWIGNVSQEASEAVIRDKFAQFGEVDSVTVYSSRNYAFVNYRNLDHAIEAKNRLQGFVLGGMAIRIEYAKGVRINLFYLLIMTGVVNCLQLPAVIFDVVFSYCLICLGTMDERIVLTKKTFLYLVRNNFNLV